MNIDGAYRQPTFLYESVWNVLGFIVLIFTSVRKKGLFKKKGEVLPRVSDLVRFWTLLH